MARWFGLLLLAAFFGIYFVSAMSDDDDAVPGPSPSPTELPGNPDGLPTPDIPPPTTPSN